MNAKNHITSDIMRDAPGYCKICKRPISSSSYSGLCPICERNKLFTDVREYIRENDVHEEDVAAHFGIPVEMVRDWIKEGRITYKGDDKNHVFFSKHCEICGRPIEFGSVCMVCLHKKKENKKKNISGSLVYNPDAAAGRDEAMRFINRDDKK